MKMLKKISLIPATFFSLSVQAASTVHFSSDFNNAIDTGSVIVDNGYQLNTVFGDPGLVDGALQFNLGGTGLSEQVGLGIFPPVSHKIFSIEFDLFTQNLVNSNYSFSVLFDTPVVQNLNFRNCCSNSISAFNPFAGSPLIGGLGLLEDDKSMNVKIGIDLIDSIWTIDIAGVGSGTGGFYSENGSIERMRMSLSPALGGIDTPDPSINVYVDNLRVVSAVPLPASVWLFGSGLISMFGFAKRRRILKRQIQ